MYCMECGAKLPDGAKFCMNCGTKVGTVKDNIPSPAAPAVPHGCTPGKKYDLLRFIDDEKLDAVIGKSSWKGGGWIPFKEGIFLDDGTFVAWVDTKYNGGHAEGYMVETDGGSARLIKKADTSKQYENLKDYSLYRIDPDGNTEYLNAGHPTVPTYDCFIRDGVIYWVEFEELKLVWRATGIYDDEPARILDEKPE